MQKKQIRQHIRDFRYSPLFRQKDEQGNLRPPPEIAREEFKRINNNHRPKPLPKSAQKELDRILESADREVEKLGV